MNILRKNVMWIALIGAVLGAYAVYTLEFKKETPTDPLLGKAQFTGKLPIDNPNIK